MKINNKLLGTAAVAIATFGLVSCTNELHEADFNGNNSTGSASGISLVKTPDVVAWSGQQTLGNTGFAMSYSTASTRSDVFSGNAGSGQDVGQGQTNDKWKPFDNPTIVGADEKDKVLAALKVKTQDGKRGYIHEEIVFPWENYFMQDVLRGVDSGCPSNSWLLYAYNGGGYEMVTNSGQIDYHAVFMQNGSQVRANNTALMVNMAVGDYDAMAGNQFYFHMNCHDFKDWFDSYIVVEVDGNYYICVDFACASEDHDNGNEIRYHDWDYNDWIIKITPAIPLDNPSKEFPIWDNVNHGDETPTEPDNGEGTETPENPEDDSNVNAPNPGQPVYHNSEVEANYAILDSHNYEDGIIDLVTKLSIHVRHATDVEIRIPIPFDYVIESDDLYIFKEHYDGQYGGSLHGLLKQNANQQLEYNIAGNTVVLHVDFTSADGVPYNYIKVWTEGINKAVIDACWEENQDGINFEIMNYFQTTTENDLTRDMLRDFMNSSTIEFLDSEPNYYINAFGFKYVNGNVTSEVHPDHATVTPLESEGYDSPYRTTHLNSTPYNDIYVLGSAEDADALHKQ